MNLKLLRYCDVEIEDLIFGHVRIQDVRLLESCVQIFPARFENS